MSGIPIQGNASGLSMTEIARRRRENPNLATLQVVRNRLLLPSVRLVRPHSTTGKTRPERDAETIRDILPVWEQVAKHGPFGWIFEIESALNSILGRADPTPLRDTNVMYSNRTTWMSPRLAANIIASGWIPVSDTMLRKHEDIANHTHPITTSWLAELAREKNVPNPSELFATVLKKTIEDGYAAPRHLIYGRIHDNIESGRIRLAESELTHLVPRHMPEISNHLRMDLANRMRAFRGIDLTRRKTMNVIENIEADTGTRDETAFRRIVLGLSLMVASGHITASSQTRNLCAIKWR